MTTRELFWKRGLGSYTEQDAVDWALDQLASRETSPNLATLASSVSPYNYFEIEDLLSRALDEIGISEPAREESYRDFICDVVRRVLEGTLSEREGCGMLSVAHGGDVDRGELQPFWLLDMARQDYEAQGFQYYDERFAGDNWSELVRIEATRALQDMCCGRAKLA